MTTKNVKEPGDGVGGKSVGAPSPWVAGPQLLLRARTLSLCAACVNSVWPCSMLSGPLNTRGRKLHAALTQVSHRQPAARLRAARATARMQGLYLQRHVGLGPQAADSKWRRRAGSRWKELEASRL